MADANLTADRLRELLSYNPDTGNLVAIADRNKGPRPWRSGETIIPKSRSIIIDGVSTNITTIIWLLFYGTFPRTKIIFVNGDATDRRICNIRERSTDNAITADVIRDLFDYDCETGLFYRKVRTSNRIRIGDHAGTVGTEGYVSIKVNGKSVKAHRLAWLHFYGQWPDGEIDHINCIRSDNRIANLRVVDRAGNTQNTRLPRKDNATGYKGVWRTGDKWKAQIQHNKTQVRIGVFNTPEEAHAAYLEAKRRLHSTCTI